MSAPFGASFPAVAKYRFESAAKRLASGGSSLDYQFASVIEGVHAGLHQQGRLRRIRRLSVAEQLPGQGTVRP
jgi:hypothetical protein